MVLQYLVICYLPLSSDNRGLAKVLFPFEMPEPNGQLTEGMAAKEKACSLF